MSIFLTFDRWYIFIIIKLNFIVIILRQVQLIVVGKSIMNALKNRIKNKLANSRNSIRRRNVNIVE